MNLADRYLAQSEFSSYEDFSRNFKINVPGNFNFAYDVIDEYARLEPTRLALVWCNDDGEERFFTFADLKKYSDKAANLLKDCGIGKGDKVMLILRRRYEFFFVAFGLAKIGAVYIPSTDQLTEKDIIYRNNAAGVKAIVAYNKEEIIGHVENAKQSSPTVQSYLLVGGGREGWVNFDEEIGKASAHWTRPLGEQDTNNDDVMLLYFTSGTTSMPKMTVHSFTYPLGHIVTAKYWHRVREGGLHLTVADSGWAKFGWGKIYGQWLCGAVQFLYDMDRFDPGRLMEKIDKYRLTTFCAPPTIYRFLLQHEMEKYDLSSLRHCSTAGEPLNPEVFNQFHRLTGLKIYNGFGQSESTVMVANFPWDDVDPGSMGKPNPAYDIDIVDEDGNSCDMGVEGELVVRNCDSDKPVGLFCGYYNDKTATDRCGGMTPTTRGMWCTRTSTGFCGLWGATTT